MRLCAWPACRRGSVRLENKECGEPASGSKADIGSMAASGAKRPFGAAVAGQYEAWRPSQLQHWHDYQQHGFGRRGV
jgi:hypothetical protein